MKSYSHVYMANLLIADLEKNKFQIPFVEGAYQSGSPSDNEHFAPPLVFPWQGGAFIPPPSVRSAILNNKACFRAGAIGPDMFPDFLFGQGIIHPDHSGVWLHYLFAEYGKRPHNDPDRQKIYAFLLGQMMHYAGDLFGHGYVNDYAEGWFPSVTKLVQEKYRDIVTRHMMVESYMDKKVPKSTPIDIEIPYGFLYDCFTDLQGIRGVIGTFGEPFRKDALETLQLMPLYHLIKLRDEIYNVSQKSGVNMLDIGNYFKSWHEDIEGAINDWFHTWGEIAAGSIQTFSFDEMKDKVLAWKDRHLSSIIGVPDWITAITKGFSYITDILCAPFKAILDKLEDMLIELIIRSIAPLNELRETWRKLKDAMENPEKHFDDPDYFPVTGTKGKLDADFGNYGKVSSTTNQKFRAFSDCLTMGKLCLMGPENLNLYFGSGDVFRQTESEQYIKTLNVRIKTSEANWSGTDDNIYFDLYTKSGRMFSCLFDNKWKDDFERGSEAEYPFTLPCQIAYSDLWGYGIHKNYIVFNDDWIVERFTITDPRSGYVLANDVWNKRIRGKGYHRRSFKKTLANQKSIITVDPRIITFLFSLDGQDRSTKNPALVYPWEDTGFAAYQAFTMGGLSLGDLPEIAFPNTIHLYGEPIPPLDAYYLNLNRNFLDENDEWGHHEVHAGGCGYVAQLRNCINLGMHLSGYDAMSVASMLVDAEVDGCYYCMNEFHTK